MSICSKKSSGKSPASPSSIQKGRFRHQVFVCEDMASNAWGISDSYKSVTVGSGWVACRLAFARSVFGSLLVHESFNAGVDHRSRLKEGP
jgi:hypothetical protein